MWIEIGKTIIYLLLLIFCFLLGMGVYSLEKYFNRKTFTIKISNGSYIKRGDILKTGSTNTTVKVLKIKKSGNDTILKVTLIKL